MKQEALDGVVRNLYESLLTPERRIEMIGAVIDGLGYRQGVWWIPHGREPGRSDAAYTGDPYVVDVYVRHYARRDTLAADVRACPVGAPVALPRAYNEYHYPRDPYYNEFLRGMLGVGGAYALPVAHEHDQLAHFTIYQELEDPEPGPEVAGVLRYLAPHLRQFHRLYQQMGRLHAERNDLAAAVDGFRCAVIGVDAGMRIVVRNAAADGMLAADGPLVASRGWLSARDADDDIALTRLVVEASAARETGAGGYRRLGGVGGPVARVAPVRDEDAAYGGHSATALIFVSQAGGGDRQSDLQEAFGFTPAEARIAGCLLEGCPIKDIAERLGLREQTVRHHTKALFTKTGTRRQGELIHLLVTAFGLYRPA